MVDLEQFFREHGIDVFSEVGLDALSIDDQSSIREFFPDALSVIVFGKEVPMDVYLMPAGEKTRGMFQITESVEQAALNLTRLFFAEQSAARPVPLLFPIRIVEGRLMGLVRLKQIAEAGGLGSIGKSTLLLTPQFGPRLVLGGVVTARSAQKSGGFERPESSLCTGCERCIRACPGHAIGRDGVDAFRCQSISAWIPRCLVPAAKWMLRRTLLLHFVAPLVPWIARHAAMPCSLCVTECPLCAIDTEKGKLSDPGHYG